MHQFGQRPIFRHIKEQIHITPAIYETWNIESGTPGAVKTWWEHHYMMDIGTGPHLRSENKDLENNFADISINLEIQERVNNDIRKAIKEKEKELQRRQNK